MTKGERKALQELSKRDDIVKTKADKGGAVVIIDVKDHIKEAESQLENKYKYDRLKYDLIETHNRLVNDTIERFKKQKMMKEKVAEGLNTENPRSLPVVSSVNCHTSNISKYVDFHIIYNIL